MITLQLKTNTGAIFRTYYNGTYSNAVDYYLGRVITESGANGIEYSAVSEVFEIPTTEPEPYYEQQ